MTTRDDRDRCWNHFPLKTQSSTRFNQCKNKATWFYYDDSSRKKDKTNKITGAVACQLCDSCYNEETAKPEAQQIFEPELFRRRYDDESFLPG